MASVGLPVCWFVVRLTFASGHVGDRGYFIFILDG